MPLGLLRATFQPRRRAEFAAARETVAHAEGWLSDAEGMLLFELARECSSTGAVIEIGSWKGRSTIWLALGSRRGAGAPVYAIDPHTGSEEHQEQFGAVDTLAEFRANVARAGVDAAVVPLVTTSVDAASRFHEPVGLAFIDGAHDYESVRADIEAWYPKLAPGGTIAFHDVTGTWPGTWAAVCDHAVGTGRFGGTRFVHSIVYARKRANPSSVSRMSGRLVLRYKRCWDASRPLLERAGRILRQS